MGIGIMNHREPVAQEITAWTFMPSIKASAGLTTSPSPHTGTGFGPPLTICPLIMPDCHSQSNLRLKIDQMGRILMAGVINLKICVIKTQIDRIASLDIAMNIPVTFNAAGIGPPHQMEVMKIIAWTT